MPHRTTTGWHRRGSGTSPTGEVGRPGRAKEGSAPGYSPHAQIVSLPGEEQIMSDNNTSHVPKLVLDQWRELHRKQDEQMRSWRNATRGIPLAVVSAGSIVVAAASDLGDVYALIVLIGATALVAFTVIAELLALRWKAGTDIADLDSHAKDHKSTALALEKAIVSTSKAHYQQNKRCLSHIKIVCAYQTFLVLVSAITLTVGLVRLPSNAQRQQDRFNEHAEAINKVIEVQDQMYGDFEQDVARLDLELSLLPSQLQDLLDE